MPWPKTDALLAQALDPAAEQGRSLLALRENAPACADKGLDPESFRPCAEIVRREIGEQAFPPARGVAVTRGKILGRLGVRQVQAAATRHEELAAH